MKKQIYTYLKSGVLALMAMAAVTATAKPADPRPRTITQPDGTTVTVTLRGDEHNHYYLSTDGHLLTASAGAFYYGEVSHDGRIIPTDVLAHDINMRTTSERSYLRGVNLEAMGAALDQRALMKAAVSRSHVADESETFPGLYPWKLFPSKGTPKTVVILVDFPDQPFKVNEPYDYFNRLLNEPGFSLYKGTGSVSDYYRENSMGQFQPEFDVFGPVTMPNNYSYYGENDAWGNDKRPYEMIIDACRLLDDTVDFSQYDSNGDGEVENVYVYYAGLGESGEGDANTVWPHSWRVSYGTNSPLKLDGVSIDRYACSNEWEFGRPDGIGTFVHEFSHVLGLPDLYSTTYNNAYTPGPWSIMDTGVYNNEACTPPYMSGYERIALGWLTPKIIDGPDDIEIRTIDENEAYVIRTPKNNEYYVLENRQKHGWDTYLPGHGMLIWQIDYNRNAWYNNEVNNTPSHQRVDLIEADGSNGDNRSGQTFPGKKNVTSFTDDTTPSMRTWSNEPLNLPIENIKETNGLITFMVKGGYVEFMPVELTATTVKARSIEIAWTGDDQPFDYLVTAYSATADGLDLMEVDGWTERNVGNVYSVTIDGLQPETEYYIDVRPYNGYVKGPASNLLEVRTPVPTFAEIIPTAHAAESISNTSFVATWTTVDEADSYRLYVYTKELTETSTVKCDFTGGVAKLPEGWTSNSTMSYNNQALTGEAAPSLRLSTPDNYIKTADYPEDILSISFWHRGNNVPEDNSMQLHSWVDGTWTEVATWQVTTTEGGSILSVERLPEGTRTLKITFGGPTRMGSVAIDDIVLNWGGKYTNVMLAGYDGAEVNGTEVEVKGLEPSNKYYYAVTGVKGDISTMMSNEVSVITALSGIADVGTTDTYGVSVTGGTLYIRGQAGARADIYEISGRPVATTMLDDMGRATLNTGYRGILLVKIADKTIKISI